jgi:hypothetical protein
VNIVNDTTSSGLADGSQLTGARNLTGPQLPRTR